VKEGGVTDDPAGRALDGFAAGERMLEGVEEDLGVAELAWAAEASELDRASPGPASAFEGTFK